MPAAYRALLQQVRLAFPQPVSDRVHDSYFVHSIMRALDLVDGLKSELPLLGRPVAPDYEKARKATLREQPASIEEVTAELVPYLEGMTIFGHPRTQQNVIAQPSIPALIGVLLASLYNPNLTGDEYSRLVAQAEVEVSAMTAALLGYDPRRAGGVFTFGGTGATLYGARIGLEKACPGSLREGLREDAVILASDAAHYCRYGVAGWLGLGARRLLTAPTNDHNEVDLRALAELARGALKQGRKIAAFIATMGTTDAFGLDDLEGIVGLRDELVKEFGLPYAPHVHADAVIGWAWSVFNDYPVEDNPQGPQAHPAGPGRRLSPPPPPGPGRLRRHRLPQDRLRPLRRQPPAGQGRR
jgi:glutamate/tyrosine decarboxylase-like PLP-dependent enzyme